MVGQPDNDWVFGCAIAVYASAITGDSRQHGRQTVHSANLDIDVVWCDFVVTNAIKSTTCFDRYRTGDYDFDRFRDVAGAVV